MCGVCGIAPGDRDEVPDADALVTMLASLRHRGPDGEGVYHGPGIGLGARRLAIIDVRGGQQPLASEDGGVVAVCNGEIYNFVELRERLQAGGHRFRTGSDAEVIVHLYEDRGAACVEALRGMFGLAVWDARRRRLLLARDRLGIKPMHYAVAHGRLYFGSEQKAILAAGAVSPALDAHALGDLVAPGFVVGPRTLFAGIRQLPPGHYLIWEAGALSLHRYWDLEFPPADPDARSCRAVMWAEELRDALDRSVRLHLASDVPVGAWLSGGIDSSAVVALMSAAAPRPVQTFSITFEGLPDDEVREHGTLDRFARYGVARHHVTCGPRDLGLLPDAVWHGESPAALSLILPRLVLARATAPAVKVVLTGEGSDELLGGYPWFRTDRRIRRFSRWPPLLRRAVAAAARRLGRDGAVTRLLPRVGPIGPSWYAELVGPACGRLPASLLSIELRERLDAMADGDRRAWATPEAFGTWHPAHQLHYYDATVFLPDYVVHALDRASMACSLEARVPFLDHEVVELCARIPPALVLRGGEEKHVLREAFATTLPADIVRRPKRPFLAPMERWLRGPLPERLERLLSADALRAAGYFDAGAVAALLTRQRGGHVRAGRVLLTVLGLQLFDELFVRRAAP